MPYIRVPDCRNPNWTEGMWGGPEYIWLDVENPQHFEVIEVNWRRQYGQINYNVCVRIIPRSAAATEVHIHCPERCNRHLFDRHPDDAKEIIWGKHVLYLTTGENSGRSTWNGEEGPGWSRQRRRITTTRLQRAQAEFRVMLLDSDKVCTVTGETCHAVLEAAHVVPVHRGGRESLSNGILLRSDVHRLFGAKLPGFRINPETGEVLTSDFHYSGFDLCGAQIDEKLIRRTQKALRWRQKNGL